MLGPAGSRAPVIACSAGLKGKSAAISSIASLSPGPTVPEGEEGDREGDHESEQRDGADLPRRRSQGRARRPERRAPGEDRDQPEAEATPVQGHEQGQPGEHQQRHHEADRRSQRDLLAQQGRGRDEAPGQPWEGVLLPLQGERAGDQQHGDEGKGEGRRDGDREDFERGVGGVDDLLVDRDRLREAGEKGPGGAEVGAGEHGEAQDFVHRVAQGAGWEGGPHGVEDLGRVAEAEDLDRLAEHGELTAVDHEPDEFAAFVGDPPGDHQVGLGQQRVDPVVDQPCLDRVVFVDDDFDFGSAGVRGGERVEFVDQVGRQDQRRQHIAGAHRFLGLGVALYVDALNPLADPVGDADPGQLGGADGDPRFGGDFVEEGDARLLRGS
jgi:hypothetical protein